MQDVDSERNRREGRRPVTAQPERADRPQRPRAARTDRDCSAANAQGADAGITDGADGSAIPPRPEITPVAMPPFWQRVTHLLGPVLALALVALAVWVLRDITREITWKQLRVAVEAIPPHHLLASLGLAVLAMGTMAQYDVLSCRLAGLRHVPGRLAGLAGFCGYAVSNALGFHVILGGTVRYRIYSTNGLDARAIAQIVAMSLGTIWLAIGALYAVVFVIEPGSLPVLAHAPHLTRSLGVVLGLAWLSAVIFLWRGRRDISIFGWRFPVPNGPGAIAQTVLGVADFGLAAAALYVLLPVDLRPSFPAFSLIFITAFIAGSLSHSPGGLGVLEAGILLALGAANRPDAVAALVGFRLTYYLIPFIVAAATLLWMEAMRGPTLVRWALGPVLATLGTGAAVVVAFLALRRG